MVEPDITAALRGWERAAHPETRLRSPDKRSRQRALMHQASIVAGELRIILEQLEELIMTPEEGSDG